VAVRQRERLRIAGLRWRPGFRRPRHRHRLRLCHEPYGDGVKVRASVGNLTSAAIAGADGTAKYGTSSPALDFEKDDQAFEKYSSWAASLKTTPISISRDLNEGSWNSVLIVLPGIKASEFGHLEISLDASHLKLQKGT